MPKRKVNGRRRPSSTKRQAKESSASVAVLCFACRRTESPSVQTGLDKFFAPVVRVESSSISVSSSTPGLVCSKCRRLMTKTPAARTGSSSSSHTRVLPQIQRIRQYQRVARQQSVPFAIEEHVAAEMMRRPCVACGAKSPTNGHGLTRLRRWPAGMTRPERGGFMGPFHLDNVAPCCGICNLMKGYRSVRGFVESARHIASHRGDAGDFGRYPERFPNNVSRRSRSSYIAASSTHSKTHSLTNEMFRRIVARPCRYCGKESNPPHHHNGLDRIDSACRVYSVETCDSCCGLCNIMKYTHDESFFIDHCVKVARHNAERLELPGDDADTVAKDISEVESPKGDAESSVVPKLLEQSAEKNPFAAMAFVS